MSRFTHIAWVDLETTGLSPTDDYVLEVAVVLTTTDLEVVDEYQAVVRSPVFGYGGCANDTVREMHVRNNLWVECAASHLSIDTVDGDLADWLVERAGVEYPICLAGSGVSHFDGRFIDAWLPITADRLTYYTLDVGVIRRFFELANPDLVLEGTDTKTHRALADARFHLEEARHYMDLLGALDPLAPGVVA